MNKISLGVSILALIVAVFAVIGNKSNKIGYVDSNKLIAEYKGTESARAQYLNKTKIWQANVDTLRSEFEAMVAKYNQERATMSDKEIKLQEQLLQSKRQQFSNYQQAMQQKAAEEDKKITEELVKSINEKIQQFGKNNGFDYILGATGSGTIAYGEESLDVTDLLIKELNK